MLVECLPKLDELVNVLVGRMMWCVHTNIVLPMGGWRNLRAALTVYLKSSRLIRFKIRTRVVVGVERWSILRTAGVVFGDLTADS